MAGIALDAAVASHLAALHRDVVAAQVVEGRLERDGPGEALLDAGVVLVGPQQRQVGVAELRVQLLGLRRLVEDAGAQR